LIILGHQTKDRRINAYPSFTKYDGINRTPTFLMIDIDQKDFASKDKFDRALNRILKKIKTSIHTWPSYRAMDWQWLSYLPIYGRFYPENEL